MHLKPQILPRGCTYGGLGAYQLGLSDVERDAEELLREKALQLMGQIPFLRGKCTHVISHVTTASSQSFRASAASSSLAGMSTPVAHLRCVHMLLLGMAIQPQPLNNSRLMINLPLSNCRPLGLVPLG